MSIIRFGAKCDMCGVEHNNYSVGDIAHCEDCGDDLCDSCANLTNHSTRDLDEQGRRRRCITAHPVNVRVDEQFQDVRDASIRTTGERK